MRTIKSSSEPKREFIADVETSGNVFWWFLAIGLMCAKRNVLQLQENAAHVLTNIAGETDPNDFATSTASRPNEN